LSTPVARPTSPPPSLRAMKPAARAALLALLPAAAAVTPLQKVVSMLDSMLAKGKAEKHEEEVEFARFKVWCDDTRQQTQKNDEGAGQITQLQADMDKAASDAEVLQGEVEALEAEVGKAKEEVKSAQAVRDKENADYLAQHQDYSESIDACERAVAVLKSRSADVPQSLAQVRSSALVPPEAKAMVESLLALRSDSRQAPEANAYEFQSGSVVQLLEKLTIRFKDERLALQKAEINSKHNFEMLLQQLTTNIKRNSDSASEKSAMRAGRLKDAATAKGDLEVTTQAKTEDEQTLSDTITNCQSKSQEFEENQVTRAEEVKAIQQAIGILSSDAVKGHAETYLPAMLQAKAKGRALAQLRNAAQKDADMRKRATEYLQSRAKALGSRYLSVMAARVAGDPFGKVKQMIKDLIVKLMEEANAEADHHAYCTSELATNKMTREDKSAEVEKLSAETEGLSAAVAELGSEITELSDAVAELQGSRVEATKIRDAEKATNAKTTADAKEAQLAVQQAIAALRNFYESQGEGAPASAALLQAKKKGAAAHREPYKGMGGESTGVMGMLEVILSDFARLETETSSAEDQAARAFEKYMAESEEEIAVKDTTRTHKEEKKQQTEKRLRSTKKELDLTQEELDAALSYYDKLKVDCLDTNLSYEDRVKMREEEIQSLKEALKILNGEDTLV